MRHASQGVTEGRRTKNSHNPNHGHCSNLKHLHADSTGLKIWHILQHRAKRHFLSSIKCHDTFFVSYVLQSYPSPVFESLLRPWPKKHSCTVKKMVPIWVGEILSLEIACQIVNLAFNTFCFFVHLYLYDPAVVLHVER